MIWLIWRQHRKQALFTLAALAALAAVMVPTGLAMHAKYDSLGLGACRAALGNASMITQTEAVSRCESLGHQLQQEYGGMVFIAVLFVVLPVLVGVFFGAPLVAREVEQGTHRLVWTQGVTRLQWALAKFGVVGAMTTALSVGYALGVSWWFQPLVSASTGRLNYLSFDVQGIVPIAYTLFALALGVFAGTYWRKVLPAMGIALVGFAAVRVAIEVLARPRYLPAQSLTFAPTGGQTPNPASGELGDGPRCPQRGRGAGPAERAARSVPARRLRRLPGRSWRGQLAAVPAGGPVLALPRHRDRDLRAPGGGAGLLRPPPAADGRLTRHPRSGPTGRRCGFVISPRWHGVSGRSGDLRG
ncbi:ABC transporter permease subunit [Amycolatopsis sp. NPDC051716]|uniref:ABC transporter permease n=1 Tax=Amycolatopsis sp. NPDC051716 TaxID=3155804 RepID=UPI00341A6C8B